MFCVFFEIVALLLKLIYFKKVWFWTYLNHTPYDLRYLVEGHFKCTSYFPSEKYIYIFIPFIFLSITIATSINSIKPYWGRTKGNGGLGNGSYKGYKIMCTSLHIFHKENVNLKKLTLILTTMNFFIYQNCFYKNHKSKKQ